MKEYQFIDCHCHLLPGVDDGSDSKTDSRKAFVLLKQQGCIGCVLTSHMSAQGNRKGRWWFAKREAIEFAYGLMPALTPPFPLRLGAEVNVRDVNATVEALDAGGLLAMAGFSMSTS